MSDLLFVYGTLLTSVDNEFSRFLKNNSRSVGSGAMQGRLYMIDWFPGAIESTVSSDKVYGQVLEIIGDADAVLNKLDEYEGFYPNEPDSNEFVRKRKNIVCSDKTYACWVYLYNHPIDNLEQIMSGNFAKHLNP